MRATQRPDRDAPARSRWPGRQTPYPISEAVMVSWARLVADCRTAGVHRAVKLTDALIAATAIEHGLPVVTHDGDFDQIARACPALSVIKV